MKKTILDLRTTTNRDALYVRIMASFSFPSYFGRNLDALYDCLTEIAEDTCVALILPDAPPPAAVQAEDGPRRPQAEDGAIKQLVFTPWDHPSALDPDYLAYLEKLRATFEDAEEANPHLYVLVVE